MITARKILSKLFLESVRIDYTEDYYAIMGFDIEPGEPLPTQDEIKRAYRELAKGFHPDYNPGDKESEELFKEVSLAYEVLGNPKLRADYDKNRRWSTPSYRSQTSPSPVYPDSFYWESSDYWCSWKERAGIVDIQCVLALLDDFPMRLVVTLPGNLRVRCDYLGRSSRFKWEELGSKAEKDGIQSLGITLRNLETRSSAREWKIFPPVRDPNAHQYLVFVMRDKRR
jgi:curved DNA-binding protein CbpA